MSSVTLAWFALAHGPTLSLKPQIVPGQFRPLKAAGPAMESLPLPSPSSPALPVFPFPPPQSLTTIHAQTPEDLLSAS